MRSTMASNSHFLFLWDSFSVGVSTRVVSVAVEKEQAEDCINES